jgi:transposase
MSERLKFIFEWERRRDVGHGRIDVAELCRQYGVSRQTGYLWIRRYQEAGSDVRALEERSRRPQGNSRAVTLQMQDLIVEARKAHPKWGPVPACSETSHCGSRRCGEGRY